jgi:hypothetical membrane protein
LKIQNTKKNKKPFHPTLNGANMRNTVQLKIGAACAVAAPIWAFTFILVAIASYPQFNWANNALSDLGVQAGVTAPLFTVGLVVSGFLALVFAVLGLWLYLGNLAGKIGTALFAVATVALIAIGIFNEHFSPTHYIVSVAFFSFAPLALFAITASFWLGKQPKMAWFTLGIGVAAALPWILEFTIQYVPNVAVPEFISGLLVSAWALVLGFKMFKAP